MTMTTDAGPSKIKRWLLGALAAAVVGLGFLLLYLVKDPRALRDPAPTPGAPAAEGSGLREPSPPPPELEDTDPRAVAGLSVFEATPEMMSRFHTAMEPAFKSCSDELRARRPGLGGTAKLDITAVNNMGNVGFLSGTLTGIPDPDFNYCVLGLLDMIAVPVDLRVKGMQRIGMSFEVP